MILFAGFVVAVIGHVLYKWLGWYAAHRENTFRGYWVAFWPLVLRGAAMDALIFGLYQTGLLIPLARSLSAQFSVALPTDLPLPDLTLRSVQFWGGAGLGIFAESFGKTCLPGILRLYSASVRKLIDLLPTEKDPPEVP